MRKQTTWPVWLWSALIVAALTLLLKSDLSQLQWAAAVSREGHPPPALDLASPTGYALGQRHFLGTYERGETYRWIAATQQFLAEGPFAAPPYLSDSLPEGRPQLQPRLYLVWLSALAWTLQGITGEPLPLAVERTALWEPVLVHLLAFAALLAFMARRHGLAAAAAAGWCFVLFPPFAGQFLPGVLTTRTAAMLLSAYALALNLPRAGSAGPGPAFGIRGAVTAALALWLDPAWGFPAVLLTAATGALLPRGVRPAWFTWSLTGAGLTLVAWLIDRAPWATAAGELRYVHPLYALAWLGLGLALSGARGLRAAEPGRARHLLLLAASLGLFAPLVWVQLERGYHGWLYTGAALRRLTSLDETGMFDSVFAWLARVPLAESALLCAPWLGATGLLLLSWLRPRSTPPAPQPATATAALLLVGLLALTCFKIRWGVLASLVALPLCGHLGVGRAPAWRRGVGAAIGMFLAGLWLWSATRPAAWHRPSVEDGPGPADLTALLHRHFAHWLASHHPGQPVSALASPELSDSLVFHGGTSVLLSTAWESYPGQIATSRILSAPEASEAEAVLHNRGVTHLILTSWDPVLPLLVKQPDLEGKDTLYARLQRWVLPLYLRPVPYRLPAVPGFDDQKLAVFKVTPPQDEALALSRLAEYFVEMDRSEPARLAAQALAAAFADDPNARLARAYVHAHTRDQSSFDREVARLAADVEADRIPSDWDRRVQRAIVLALGHRQELARRETARCLAEASPEALFALTPLQAHRLGTLARSFGLSWPDPALARLLSALGAEYTATRPATPAR